MSFFDGVWDVISRASTWMESNKSATHLMGTALMGVGGYFAQKEANKDLMRRERELLNLRDQMQSKYAEVPDIDFAKYSLTVDELPNLANGGILTKLKKRSEETKGVY
ncbi:MAG: hypothetical protein Q4A60_03395 [Pasteurellaceae bacterium]|nr:hypothetical protein [Pasteurellaceae bacterium]